MCELTNDWPYSARPDIAARYRIAVIDNIYPRTEYIVCVAVGDDVWGGLMPTESEFHLIQRYLAYKLSRYSARDRAAMARDWLDIDRGLGLIMVLLKRADNDWCYRLNTWDRGATLSPAIGEPVRLDLAAVLERRESPFGSWKTWQAAHPVPTA